MTGVMLYLRPARAIAIALVVGLGGMAPVYAQASCRGCDKSMNLNAKEWECLRRKVTSGELGSARTPVVFLSLSQQSCEGATRSIYTEPPAVNSSAGRVYTLSQEQARCLAEIARDPALARAPGLSIDFAQACAQ